MTHLHWPDTVSCAPPLLQSYISICDLLIVFSSQLASNSHLKTLVYSPDRTMQGMLNDFIQTYVFVDDDDGQWSRSLQLQLQLYTKLGSEHLHESVVQYVCYICNSHLVLSTPDHVTHSLINLACI